MPQFIIDEVCPKGSVYPIVSFQNVCVTEKFETHDCLLLEDEKTGKMNILTELCDTIYTGEEENEDLRKTLILARNKTTGKVRLIEVGHIELKPLIKSNLDTTEEMDTRYLEHSRKLGSKKLKQIMEQHEKIEISIETVTEQMQNIADSITEDQLDLPSYNKIDSDKFYIPAINREATKVEEVYDIDTILTPEQYEQIYSEIDSTEFTSNLNPFLKSIASKTLSQKHTVLLVYANTLLQLYGTLMRDIRKKNFTACQYSVTLNEIVIENFLSNTNGKRRRSLQYKNKSLCHALVFILLINSYKFNIDDLCQQLNLALWTVTSAIAITGATLVSVGSKKFAQLNMETNDNFKTKTNSIKTVGKSKVPFISDALSKCEVNKNNKEVIGTRNIQNKNNICNIHSSLCTEEKPCKCDICPNSSHTKSTLNINNHTHTGEKPYKCNICESSYKQSNSLRRHFLTHIGEKPFKCDICQNSFHTKSTLKIHNYTHTGDKPFKCNVCQSSYIKSSSLRRHIQIHTGEKPHKCDICQRTFTESSYLRFHIHTHTGEKPYKCDVCQRSFRHPQTFKTHIRIHTGEKPYKCDICHSSFKHKISLTIHISKHTGVKPYKCHICQTSFVRKISLNEHIFKHTDVKPYKCDICPSSFIRSSNLKRHSCMHTGNKP